MIGQKEALIRQATATRQDPKAVMFVEKHVKPISTKGTSKSGPQQAQA